MADMPIESNQEIERNWAMLAHLAGLVPIPLLSIIGPVLIWYFKKENSAFVAGHAKESANFQITVLMAALISGWLCLLMVGFLCLVVVGIMDFIFVIVAAINASQGKNFRYPFSFRFF